MCWFDVDSQFKMRQWILWAQPPCKCYAIHSWKLKLSFLSSSDLLPSATHFKKCLSNPQHPHFPMVTRGFPYSLQIYRDCGVESKVHRRWRWWWHSGSRGFLWWTRKIFCNVRIHPCIRLSLQVWIGVSWLAVTRCYRGWGVRDSFIL